MKQGVPHALLVLVLAAHAALPAPAWAETARPDAKAAPAASRRASPQHGDGAELEARVAKLTRALALDARQQASLRRLLLDQRRRVQGIWSEPSSSSADRIAATRGVSQATSDRIRSLLTEEQRRKYDPPSKGDPGNATGSVHVEDWMSTMKSR